MEKILLHYYRLIDNTNNIFFVIDVIDKPIISRKYFAHFFVSDVNE